MDLENISFAISKNGELTESEYEFLTEAYRKLFIKMYGLDVFDAFLKVVKDSSGKFITKGKKVTRLAGNYSMAIDAIGTVQNDDNFELLLIYNGIELVGGGRLRKISDTEASVPDIAINISSKELEKEIWKKAISFAELHFVNQGFEKMYIEIPLQEGPLLIRASELGFTEDPNDIIVSPQTRTYLLNKTLERIKDEKSDISRK